MVTAALLSLVALGSALGSGHSQVPAELSPREIPTALRPASPTLCVRISPSHIAATSLAPMRQLMVFEWSQSGHMTTCTVDRFASVTLPLPMGAAAGDLSFRVVRPHDDFGVEASSPVRFDRLGMNQSLFVTDGNAGADLWISSHGGRSLTNLGASAAGSAAGTGQELHVPVPLPAENKKRVKQRPLRRKKLPPV